MEVWKFIDGYKSKYGRYRVSSHGRVKNGLGNEMRPHWHKKGYVMIALINDAGVAKRVQLHRLVAMAFIPNPDQLPQVNHLDGVKTNNNVSNLQWCTNGQNMRHAIETGLREEANIKIRAYVENVSRHLTMEQANEIRAIKLRKGPNAPISRKDIALKYGVTEHVIKDIRANASYQPW